jgi:phage shock protein PspC (stress-responsive transcriptional regulator)
MDKTININLGGILFQVDEEAFRILRDYLQAINSRFANVQGGHETIEDIESRIAEIFQSQKGSAGAITKENVESMIGIIGKPEDFDQDWTEQAGPSFSSQKKRMFRNPEDKIIGGVCSGIAAYLESDPVLFRILFVLFTAFFGVGFFVYIGLWIALPEARTDSQKRSMYGNNYSTGRSDRRTGERVQVTGSADYISGYNSSSKLGNAINEVFRALGRVFYIILRIFLIIIGVTLVLTGFLAILSFVLIFIFRYPGAFSFDFSGVNLIYFKDFLTYIVNPSAVSWIIVLSTITFILPMLALIYWGVKMIFWFRARDGVVSLVALVIWVMSIAALSIIGFNEGISFAETGKTTIETVLPKSQDTLYIMSDNKIADLKYDKQFSLPKEEYSVFLNDQKKELYIRTYIDVERSDDKLRRLEIRKRSAGHTESEAIDKTNGLIFHYNIKGDTLSMDEYFTCPAGRKWSADNVGIKLYIPSGTILKFEKNPRILLHSSFRDEYNNDLESGWESGDSVWTMSDNGLEPVTEHSTKQK